MVVKLDPTFKPFVQQELKSMAQQLRAKHAHQNKTYWDTTQEKWGPGGSKTKSAARQKKVKISQKAPEEKTETGIKRENKGIEYKENAEKPAPAEAAVADDAETEKSPNAKAGHSIKEGESGRESGEGSDNKNMERVVVHEDRQGPVDNRATEEDSDPEDTGTGGDNVVSKRSAQDKATEKVKCQSSASPGSSRTNQGDKGSSDEAGRGDTQSE